LHFRRSESPDRVLISDLIQWRCEMVWKGLILERIHRRDWRMAWYSRFSLRGVHCGLRDMNHPESHCSEIRREI
jgi:hypothetical protein